MVAKAVAKRPAAAESKIDRVRRLLSKIEKAYITMRGPYAGYAPTTAENAGQKIYGKESVQTEVR